MICLPQPQIPETLIRTLLKAEYRHHRLLDDQLYKDEQQLASETAYPDKSINVLKESRFL